MLGGEIGRNDDLNDSGNKKKNFSKSSSIIIINICRAHVWTRDHETNKQQQMDGEHKQWMDKDWELRCNRKNSLNSSKVFQKGVGFKTEGVNSFKRRGDENSKWWGRRSRQSVCHLQNLSSVQSHPY